MGITKMKDSMIDEKKRCKRTYDLMRNKIARIPLFLFLSFFFFGLKTVRVTLLQIRRGLSRRSVELYPHICHGTTSRPISLR